MLLLLEQVADIRNVVRALHACAKGKRQSRGYQLMQLELSRELVAIAAQLATGEWPWQPYHSFEVCDPKRHRIYGAPFRNRVLGVSAAISP